MADKNFDGLVDSWMNPEARNPVFLELAKDGDGKVDVRFFKNGRREELVGEQ